ncbi:MAG: O-antigen translocase [Bacteroidota bacterium]|nr:O-antigen translocase [Bacteroidota bacterium]
MTKMGFLCTSFMPLIKSYINKLSKNTFVRVTSANGFITIIRSLISAISNKVVAVIVGTSGIAMIGQLQNFIQISTLISSGGFNQGLTRYVAENRENENEISEFVSTSLIISAILTVITSLFIFVFSDFLSIKIFTLHSYTSIFIVFAFTLYFYNLNYIILAIVNGFQRYILFFKINFATTIVGFILTVGLVLLFKEYGALLSIVLAQSVVFFITYIFIRNEYWIKLSVLKHFSKTKCFLLFQYSSITFLAAIIWPIADMIIRTYVIKNISIEEAGIWQATRKINDYITTIAIGSFSVYLLPKLSSITDRNKLKKELIDIYKIIIPMSLAGFFLLYLFRDTLVMVLYSTKFLKVSDYLLLQMLGSFFWMCKVPIMNYMLSKGLTKTYLLNELLFALIYIVLCISLIPFYKVQGIQLSFAIYNLAYLLVNLFLIRKYLHN